MEKVYGVSTGTTGEYGVGDIVVGYLMDVSTGPDGTTLCGEPVYNVFKIKDGEVQYLR